MALLACKMSMPYFALIALALFLELWCASCTQEKIFSRSKKCKYTGHCQKKELEGLVKRGEEVGPEEQDPTAEKEIGLLGLLKFIFYVVLIITLSGKFITGSFFWENEDLVPAIKSLWPVMLYSIWNAQDPNLLLCLSRPINDSLLKIS